MFAKIEIPPSIKKLISNPLTTPKHKPNNLFNPLKVLLEAVAESNNFEINLNFFENNAVMFCDKISDYNYISEHLARRLNPHKRIVVFDYTGAIKIPASRELKAKIDFKLPLNTYTIDRIWQKSLAGASIETQAVLEEIFNEIKNYQTSNAGLFQKGTGSFEVHEFIKNE